MKNWFPTRADKKQAVLPQQMTIDYIIAGVVYQAHYVQYLIIPFIFIICASL